MHMWERQNHNCPEEGATGIQTKANEKFSYQEIQFRNPKVNVDPFPNYLPTLNLTFKEKNYLLKTAGKKITNSPFYKCARSEHQSLGLESVKPSNI